MKGRTGKLGDLKVKFRVGSRLEGRVKVLKHTKAVQRSFVLRKQATLRNPLDCISLATPSSGWLEEPAGLIAGCGRVGAGSGVLCKGDLYLSICISPNLLILIFI